MSPGGSVVRDDENEAAATSVWELFVEKMNKQWRWWKTTGLEMLNSRKEII